MYTGRVISNFDEVAFIGFYNHHRPRRSKTPLDYNPMRSHEKRTGSDELWNMTRTKKMIKNRGLPKKIGKKEFDEAWDKYKATGK